jgi:ribosomal protein S27E
MTKGTKEEQEAEETTGDFKKISVQDCKHGKGIFSTMDLPCGTVVCKVTGSVLSFEETVKLGDQECYCLQIDKKLYLIPSPPFYFSNHSCDPNCGLNERLELITIKDLKKGEELCWDYSTSMLERHWTMQCLCGKENCRGIIKDFDLLPQHLQHKYKNLKIVLPYILRSGMDEQAIIEVRDLYFMERGL